MGNPDLVIVFNNGEMNFLIKGIDYETRENALGIGIMKWQEFVKEAMEIADKPEELNFEIRSINFYEL